MKKFLLTLIVLFAPSLGWAQCNGAFPAQSVCGNNTNASGVPGPVSSGVLSSLTINPPPLTLTPGLRVNQSIAGSSSFPTGNAMNLFFSSSDTATLTGANFLNLLEASYVFGGPTMQGGRQAIFGAAQLTSPSSPSNLNRNYVGVNGTGFSTTNDNGTDTGAGALGAIFGLSGWGDLQSGATNFLGVTGAELNVSVRTGASVKHKTGLQVTEHTLDAVAASTTDAGIAISGQIPAIGWVDGILFSDFTGQHAVKSTGNLIRSTGGTFANGIDLSASTFTVLAIKTPGFTVDGDGSVAASATRAGAIVTQVTNNGTGAGSSAGFQANTNAGNVALVAGSTAGNFAQLRWTGAGTFLIDANNAAGNFAFRTGATPTSALAISATQVINLPAVGTGTPAASLCIDASNNIIKKTTTGPCI